MKKIILIFNVIIFHLTVGYCQYDKKDILGTWELDKKDNGVKSDLQIQLTPKTSDKPEKIEIIIKFNEDNIVDFKQGPQSFRADFKIQKDILLLGNTAYRIKKLDTDSLIIVNESGIFPTTFYYFKSEKEFKTIKEYENHEEKYSNGQIKIRGTFHNGFEDGLWEEWYENGQKKSEKYFTDGIPTGKWKEWDENGKLIKSEKIK